MAEPHRRGRRRWTVAAAAVMIAGVSVACDLEGASSDDADPVVLAALQSQFPYPAEKPVFH